jgi:hypothetical protein
MIFFFFQVLKTVHIFIGILFSVPDVLILKKDSSTIENLNSPALRMGG